MHFYQAMQIGWGIWVSFVTFLWCRLVKDTSAWTNKKDTLESEKASLKQVYRFD